MPLFESWWFSMQQLCLSWNMLCKPDWPLTHRDSSASVFWVQGLRAYTTTPGLEEILTTFKILFQHNTIKCRCNYTTPTENVKTLMKHATTTSNVSLFSKRKTKTMRNLLAALNSWVFQYGQVCFVFSSGKRTGWGSGNNKNKDYQRWGSFSRLHTWPCFLSCSWLFVFVFPQYFTTLLKFYLVFMCM